MKAVGKVAAAGKKDKKDKKDKKSKKEEEPPAGPSDEDDDADPMGAGIDDMFSQMMAAKDDIDAATPDDMLTAVTKLGEEVEEEPDEDAAAQDEEDEDEAPVAAPRKKLSKEEKVASMKNSAYKTQADAMHEEGELADEAVRSRPSA